ncbi:MAG: ABC transporter ATP-binding protein [Gemmatimonadetes bacterium]|nr:ABC transporter ATP-binding protein [Gemmatimonadota bacterium]
MSLGTAVAVRGLSKAYTISHQAERHYTLAETALARLRAASAARSRETFWALRDVSFEVPVGEVIGIIGRNGAGKSTLLKVLSRITEPTAGEVDLYGRVSSLLEVGTGFHPELTGRENIFLNGAILGMRRAEIRQQFDAIVAFSGVEQFIDTPVKRYSSGMYVRLAFAVAAHLNPEILIVDEVLAVGDAAFQKKCLGKMQDVATQQGRTVLFVSHNMPAVENLCGRVIVMDQGRAKEPMETKAAIRHYLHDVVGAAVLEAPLAQRTDRTGSGAVRLTSCHLEDAHGRRISHVPSGSDVTVVLGYAALEGERLQRVDVGVSLSTESDQMLFVLYSGYTGQVFGPLATSGCFRCSIPRFPFAPGRYRLGARVLAGTDEADWPRDGVGEFDVVPGDFYGTGSSGYEGTAPVMITGEWSHRA